MKLIPVCTRSPTCSSDIGTHLPSSSLTLAIDGKHLRPLGAGAGAGTGKKRLIF